MVFKSKAQGTLQNVYLTDFNAAARVKVNGADAYANYDGTGVSSLTITGNTFNVGAITGIFDSDQAGFNESFFTGANSTATGITNGFNLSEFGQWTFAAHSGQYK